MANVHAMEALLSVMEKLRDPEHGCNWDKKQTLHSLTGYTLEEVYEVIDAVETGDDEQLQDELGDLLFQVVFYAQIAKEEGRFEFGQVVSAITEKLLRRHPHVFADGTLDSFGDPALKGIDAEEVAARWELIKNEERARKPAKSQTDGFVSVMDDIPGSLPALDRARKLQKRAATVGFDWQTGMEVLAKLREEIDELEAEMLREDAQGIERELGDVLFTCVNLGRHVQSDPETALRSSNRRFETRFKRMERIAQDASLSLSEMSGEQLEALWRRVKAEAAASVK